MNREEYYEYVRLLDSLQPSEPVLGKCNDGKMKLKKKKEDTLTYIKWIENELIFEIFLWMFLIIHVAIQSPDNKAYCSLRYNS